MLRLVGNGVHHHHWSNQFMWKVLEAACEEVH